MTDGWKRKMISCLNEIFVVLISVLIFLFQFLFCSILERKDDKSFKRDIIVMISFPIFFFCFNFFSGKYWKSLCPPQYSKPCPPNILNLPTPMITMWFNILQTLLISKLFFLYGNSRTENTLFI